jgi:pyruvate formate lyase activating enzyme
MTVDEAMKEVSDDAGYYVHSGGGMTLSGGEPLMQPEFSLALLKAAHERRIHTAVETSGFCRKEDLHALLPFTGLFLWDVKATDADVHRMHTSVSNERILDNLKSITALGANVRLRMVFIPELHDNESHIAALSELVSSLQPVSGWEVIPYHRLGTAKLEKLGLTGQHAFREPMREEIKAFEMNLLLNKI